MDEENPGERESFLPVYMTSSLSPLPSFSPYSRLFIFLSHKKNKSPNHFFTCLPLFTFFQHHLSQGGSWSTPTLRGETLAEAIEQSVRDWTICFLQSPQAKTPNPELMNAGYFYLYIYCYTLNCADKEIKRSLMGSQCQTHIQHWPALCMGLQLP